MKSTNTSESNVRGAMAAWLAVAAGYEPNSGLEPEEARRRAEKLIGLIRVGDLQPGDVDLSEDFKDILSAVVGSLRDSEPADRLCATADAVYQFISRIPWPERQSDEKRDLLCECAEIGWGAMGLSIAEVTRRRAAGDAVMVDRRTGLSARPEDRSSEPREENLPNVDSVVALLGLLRQRRDSNPSGVLEEAEAIYASLKNARSGVGLFDERDYCLGEAAFLAGGAFRQMGQRNQALRWFDRAEAGFRHVVNPGPGLSNVAYARLALRFEVGGYRDVLELLPSVRESFEKLGFEVETAKCRLLEAMSLKQCGRTDEAIESLRRAREGASVEPALAARVLSELGDVQQLKGDTESALNSFKEAMSLLEGSETCIAIADLKMFAGAAYWGQSQFVAARDAFRASLADYVQLGMETRVAYVRLFTADTLLHLGRPREAESEILAALPTIEEQKMVPEGFAAVALLKESVRRRKTDPNALRELREHLQKQN